jgi:hypothetical protein
MLVASALCLRVMIASCCNETTMEAFSSVVVVIERVVTMCLHNATEVNGSELYYVL